MNHSNNGEEMGVLTFENTKFLFSRFRKEDRHFLGPTPKPWTSNYRAIKTCPIADSLISVPSWELASRKQPQIIGQSLNQCFWKSTNPCMPCFSKPCNKSSAYYVKPYLFASLFQVHADDGLNLGQFCWTTSSREGRTSKGREDNGTLRRKWKEVW